MYRNTHRHTGTQTHRHTDTQDNGTPDERKTTDCPESAASLPPRRRKRGSRGRAEERGDRGRAEGT